MKTGIQSGILSIWNNQSPFPLWFLRAMGSFSEALSSLIILKSNFSAFMFEDYEMTNFSRDIYAPEVLN